MTNIKDLLPIVQSNIGGTEVNAVNARMLHAFLENKDAFAHWIKDRISQFGFVENQDFSTFWENSQKGRPRKEYLVSTDMAKELAMVERNEKGKEARRYFLECERKLKEVMSAPAYQIPQTLSEALRLAADIEEKRIALENKIKEDEPKVAFSDQVQASNVIMAKTEVAKLLDYPPRKFDDYIRQIKMLYASKNIAKQWAINSKLMVHRFFPIQHSDETIEQKPQPYFTTKGVFYVYKRMLAEGLIARNPKIELNFKG